MSVSNWEVTKAICCKPRDNNICWNYVVYPVFWTFVALISLGILYLYLVPFTNVVGHALFADYTCPPETGVWQVCGRIKAFKKQFDHSEDDVSVGFMVFLIIQITIGCFIIACLLAIFSRRKGRVRYFDSESFFCTWSWSNNDANNWIPVDDVDQSCYCDSTLANGSCLYYHAVWFFAIPIFFTTMIVGIYGGRFIAVNNLPQCTPYSDTRIGLYGCVSNTNGSYVGGKACTDCAGYGFLILCIPLFIVELLIITFYVCIKRCRTRFREIKERLGAEKTREFERRQQNQSLENFEGSGIVLKEQVKMDDDSEKIECDICCISMGPYVELPCDCKKNICKKCATQMGKCPLCRQKYTKRDIKKVIEEPVTL